MEVECVCTALAPFQRQGEQDPCVLPGRTLVRSSYSQLLFQGERFSLALSCMQLCALPLTPINQETVTLVDFQQLKEVSKRTAATGRLDIRGQHCLSLSGNIRLCLVTILWLNSV